MRRENSACEILFVSRYVDSLSMSHLLHDAQRNARGILHGRQDFCCIGLRDMQ